MYMGIDPTTKDSKPSACAMLDSSGRLSYVAKLGTNAEMLALARERRPSIVAIDSPLGLPKGMCCLEEDCDCRSVHDFKGRTAEREVLKRGIHLYITTERSFIKGMIYRSMELAEALEGDGVDVIEVYPYASKVALFGRPIPPKNTRDGREYLHRRLGDLVPGLTDFDVRWDHDLYDAVVAAYTAYLHGTGRTEALGSEDEKAIVVPLSAPRAGGLA